MRNTRGRVRTCLTRGGIHLPARQDRRTTTPSGLRGVLLQLSARPPGWGETYKSRPPRGCLPFSQPRCCWRIGLRVCGSSRPSRLSSSHLSVASSPWPRTRQACLPRLWDVEYGSELPGLPACWDQGLEGLVRCMRGKRGQSPRGRYLLPPRPAHPCAAVRRVSNAARRPGAGQSWAGSGLIFGDAARWCPSNLKRNLSVKATYWVTLGK